MRPQKNDDESDVRSKAISRKKKQRKKERVENKAQKKEYCVEATTQALLAKYMTACARMKFVHSKEREVKNEE